MKSNVVLQFGDVNGRVFPDPNNNAKNEDDPIKEADKKDKYKLRPRARRGETHARSGPTPRAPPLSKYRRRTANARERTRMREINSAFEALRRCVPGSAGAPTAPERLTKISTLRLATQYIAALAAALANSEPHTPCEPSLHFLDLCLDDTDISYEPSLSSSFSPSLSPDLSTSFCSASISPDFVESSLSSDFPDDSLSPFDPFLTDFS